jgi:hypothetical protein
MMKNKSNRHHHKKMTINKSNRPWVLFSVVIAGAVIGILFWKNSKTSQTTNTPTSKASPSTTSVAANQNLLVGRWVRTDSDGNYIIEIKTTSADGKLEASYFNPNPIKVGHAGWEIKNSRLTVMIELRDENYPGSTYTLNFFPSEDRMMGNYYQAVEGQNFDVEFVRAN